MKVQAEKDDRDGQAGSGDRNQPNETSETGRWHPVSRIAFRLFFAYIAQNFITASVISLIPGMPFLTGKYSRMVYLGQAWIGRTIFNVPPELIDRSSGLLLIFWQLVVAAGIAVVWSIMDRKRSNYDRLQQWFQLMIRFLLAPAMILYGAIKVIPTQMLPPPVLTRVGDLIPAHLLWWCIGASPSYESFTGMAELLGGVLLLVPRTALIGALVCLADMITVFMMNMCYDITVKVGSFRLLLMSVLLVAPHVPRLANLFVFNRRVEAAPMPPLFANKWLNRAPYLLLFVFGLYSINAQFNNAFERKRTHNPDKLPLYGGWSVEEFTVNGKSVPRFTDPDSWRWVFINLRAGRPGGLSVERMIGSSQGYWVDMDRDNKKMILAKYQRNPTGGGFALDSEGNRIKMPGWQAELSFDEPEADMLILEGSIDSRQIRATLRAMPLSSKTMHWILDP